MMLVKRNLRIIWAERRKTSFCSFYGSLSIRTDGKDLSETKTDDNKSVLVFYVISLQLND